jgi:hypothetical protein
MIHLAWEQKEDLQITLLIPVSGSIKAFVMDARAVNFLASVRKVVLYIKIDTGEEQSYQADFLGLKPANIENTTDISVPIASNENQTTNYCAISRGERFNEHWLSPDGWGETKFCFALEQTVFKGEVRQSNPQSHGAGITTASCPFCQALLTGSEFNCPRCGNILKTAPPEQTITATPQNFPLKVLKPASSVDIEKTSRIYRLFLILSVINIGLFILHFNLDYSLFFSSSSDAYVFSIFISVDIFLFFLLSHLFLLILIYRMWDLIQDQPCRTTPGLATWLLLVPFYQLGWAFKAIRGMAADVNSYYKNLDSNAQATLISPSYAGMLCILGILNYVFVFAYLISNSNDDDFEVIRILFFLCTTAFFVLLIPFGAAIKSAYRKIGELKK